MWALPGACFEQQLSYWHIVGHDGDVERGQAFAVGCIEIQFIRCVLEQKDLYSIQVLLFHGLEQSFTALNILQVQSPKESLTHLIFPLYFYIITKYNTIHNSSAVS